MDHSQVLYMHDHTWKNAGYDHSIPSQWLQKHSQFDHYNFADLQFFTIILCFWCTDEMTEICGGDGLVQFQKVLNESTILKTLGIER